MNLARFFLQLIKLLWYLII